MKNLLKVFSLGVMLAASSTFAHASPVTGVIVINGFGPGTPSNENGSVGPVPFTPSTTSISFTGTPVAAGNGSFLSVNAVSFVPTFTFSYGTIAPETLFSFTDGGTVTFSVNSVVFAPVSSSIEFIGVRGGGAVDPTAAYFVLTPNGPPYGGDYSSKLTLTPPLGLAPEPSGLILLGTGLVSAAGLVLRKRAVAV
jgi:hypothetical protein